MTSLKETGEFKLIGDIKKMFNASGGDLKVSIGDDCAVIKKNPKTNYLVSTDLLLEGVHFNLKFITPLQLGKKTASVNISDIAGMGGIPKFLLLSIAMPKTTSLKFTKEFFSGVKRVCKKFNVRLIGGDTSSSKGGIFLSATIIGEAKSGGFMTRSGAKPGDSVYVTGKVGDSAGGLDILLNGHKVSEGADQYLIKKHLNVTPRVDEGVFLARSKPVRAMIDMSDGIGSDIRRICEASGVGARVFSGTLPVSRQLKALAVKLKKDVDDYALYGGEDYELMFTVKADCEEKLKIEYKKKFRKSIFRIGEITKKRDVLRISCGGVSSMITESYNHFLT
jgi:thiamine-monophosphate kinase